MKKIVYMGLSFVMLNFGNGECSRNREGFSNQEIRIVTKLSIGRICEFTNIPESGRNLYLGIILSEKFQKKSPPNRSLLQEGSSLLNVKTKEGTLFQIPLSTLMQKNNTRLSLLLKQYVAPHASHILLRIIKDFNYPTSSSLAPLHTPPVA